ncbi:MAG: type II toxin-antitoxin system RelB/DinJ family antitoxin [Candidatus Nomurabacteria bacterium]|jgi:addiction module RelB/DinJ family antitoxin|nr:type II toxin-antitoxin system RelB/DinJ family antitoxin [Candidatus Nomurabacteria bacterium]
MSTTVISIRVDRDVKEKAQKVADELGFPLSTLLNAYMRGLIQHRRVEFHTAEPVTPKMAGIIREAEAEYDRGDYLGPFDSVEDAIRALKESK